MQNIEMSLWIRASDAFSSGVFVCFNVISKNSVLLEIPHKKVTCNYRRRIGAKYLAKLIRLKKLVMEDVREKTERKH